MIAFIDEHRERFGVEPICVVLNETKAGFLSVSGYYAAKSRPLSRRSVSDAELKPKIAELHRANYGVYGRRKLWHAMRREGFAIGRDQTARLMAELGIRGVNKSRRVRTTVPDETALRPLDHVDRQFAASGPNELWVADFTYVRTAVGFVYVAFVVDVFSRMIVGWRSSTSMRTDLALDALEMALWFRKERNANLIHHSDRGVQYLSIRYSERLGDAGVVASVGSKGDSYDNAMAESVNSLYKAELVFNNGPWRTPDQLELATLEWVHWFNSVRLHGELGYVPPQEFEQNFHSQTQLVGAVVFQ